MATQSKYDPNILALLSKQLGSGNRLPQFAGGGDIDPSLGAALVALGYLPKHQDMSGRYMMPGQTQGGSGLDGQTFRGLDALKQMQPQGGGGGGLPQGGYSTLPGDANWYPGAPLPQGFDPRHPTVVGRSPNVTMPEFGPQEPGGLLPPPVIGQKTLPLGPTVQEQNDMDRDRQMFQDNPDWFRQNMQRPGRVPPAPVRPQAGPSVAPQAPAPPLLPPPVTAPRTMQPPSPAQPYQPPQGQIPDPLKGVFDQARGPVGGAFGQAPQVPPQRPQAPVSGLPSPTTFRPSTMQQGSMGVQFDSKPLFDIGFQYGTPGEPGQDIRGIKDILSGPGLEPEASVYDRVAPDDWRRKHPLLKHMYPAIDSIFGRPPQGVQGPQGELGQEAPIPYESYGPYPDVSHFAKSESDRLRAQRKSTNPMWNGKEGAFGMFNPDNDWKYTSRLYQGPPPNPKFKRR